MTAGGAATRRRWLGTALALSGAPFLGGCPTPAPEALRIGAQVFTGYELVFLARSLGMLPEDRVKLIETPSATASIRALAAGAMDGACLTLDEVLGARARGIALTVVAVIDFSKGADVLLGTPGLSRLADLRGRTLGVEQSAVGAVMLDAALAEAGLRPGDVRIRQLAFEKHEAEFLQGRIDALITYEPLKTRLLAKGASQLYSSAQIPGRILDVVAIRSDRLPSRAPAVQLLVDAYFRAREAYLQAPQRHAPVMSLRLGLAPERVADAFADLDLPDRVRNKAWFSGSAAPMREVSTQLQAVMVRAGMLARPGDDNGLFDGRFI